MKPTSFHAPVIGLTVSSVSAPEQRQPYHRALEAWGAIVLDLVAGEGPLVELPEIHGLLLSGGGDVDPMHFGLPRHPQTGSADAARDEMELRLARKARSAGMPVLGICRGAQVLGVALGGKLVQDIPSLVPDANKHSNATHGIDVVQGSRLEKVLGSTRLGVNSYHHQANGALADGVRATAHSDDNVIEAIEVTDVPFMLGVQWHPELMTGELRQQSLFSAFVAAAADYARLR